MSCAALLLFRYGSVLGCMHPLLRQQSKLPPETCDSDNQGKRKHSFHDVVPPVTKDTETKWVPKQEIAKNALEGWKNALVFEGLSYRLKKWKGQEDVDILNVGSKRKKAASGGAAPGGAAPGGAVHRSCILFRDP